LLALLASLLLVRADGNVLDLTPDNFDQIVDGSRPAFVEFYAPWCGHCKNLAPEYEKVGDAFAALKDKVIIAKVDADAHRSLGERFEVKGFPTLKFFPKGNTASPEKYEGGRTDSDIISFIEKRTGLVAKKVVVSSSVTVLTSQNFDNIVLDTSRDALVEFYAPWCGHCKRLAPDYEKVGSIFKNDKGVVIAKVDCDAESALCGKYGVSGYPTIKFFPKESKDAPEDYSMGRDVDSFVTFINDKAHTKRTSSGRLREDAGRVSAIDALVADVANKDKDEVYKQVQEAAENLTGQDQKSAKFYLKVLEALKAKPDFVQTETERLNRMINSGSLNGEKVDEFTIRVNILSAFQ